MIYNAELEGVQERKWTNDKPVAGDPHRAFEIAPGSKFALSDTDRIQRGADESFESVITSIGSDVEQISRLQYMMHAEGKHSLLIVLQGIDAAGKDSVAQHIQRSMDPAGCRVVVFRQPTTIELRHDFLWRVHHHVPAKGEVVIFNRSHYEDVLHARVHQTVSSTVLLRRYDLINEFERLLTEDNGTRVLKFYLHISKSEQLARFKHRLEDPARQWKISESDYAEREHWDAYMEAFEDMLLRTSTGCAPWYVIPANDRLARDLAISHVIVRTLEDLHMKTPEPTVDLARIRQRYHAAAQACDTWSNAHVGSGRTYQPGDTPSLQK
jgi:PPK2 family polyphosphate:nucleotide phosphotransferase